MSQRPIIDAGPSLNFLSINKERLLIAPMGKLSAPEAVQMEVFRKASQDVRFRPAAVSWRKLRPTYIEVLADDPTTELARVVNRITNQRMDDRLRQSKDLGETMVIAHAVVAAEAGADVVVLIDDGRGAQDATREV
jgi:predicted nucleic acid-binding protein